LRTLFIIAVLLGLFSSSGFATHNRAGDITYEWMGGLTYKVTITTCTKTSAPADRDELELDWGDGNIDTLPRNNVVFTGSDHQKNVYTGTHTYLGAGSYTLKMYDPNRNSDIQNILNSVYQPFCIQSMLVVSPVLGGNNSVVLQECPCPEYACVNKRYCYTMGAYDPDGDSLAFELAIPYGGDECTPLGVGATYVYPDAAINNGGGLSGGGGSISIDARSGTLCWNVPGKLGEFNVAIKIKEYRAGVLIGWVLRDIQITVLNCNNEPPEITPLPDTCVEAGTNVQFPVNATDIDAGDILTMSTYGQPYTFNAPNTAVYTDNSPATVINGNFSWLTSCAHVRNAAYTVTFEVTDNDPAVQLTDVKSAYIRVYAPAVQNLTVTPVGNTMQLAWSPSVCSNILGYRVYRKIGSVPFTENCCEPGTAQMLGYSFIAQTTSWSDTTYIDNSALVLGTDYCYLVVALFDLQTESCISQQVCAQLKFDVPVLTHVTIDVTNTSMGTDTVIWARPKELDTAAYAFFKYMLYRSAGMGTTPSTLVYTTPTSALLSLTDTIYFDSGLNTSGSPYTYKVEIIVTDALGNDYNIGGGPAASSVYLSSSPADNAVILSWNSIVPWQETLYEVYKETFPGSGIFNLLATTTAKTYTDTGLINGADYCYRVKAIGTYGNADIIDPLINWSQIRCESPTDLTPPCPPVLSFNPDCELEYNQLFWTNPNNSCADDVMSYNIYYSTTDSAEFSLIATISNSGDTSYIHNNNGSLAGCYYITAIDSAQYGNESIPGNIICADNCPYYWLPNVFTPNNDGKNDKFIPFPYRFIESVDLIIYNRWGIEVFRTTDPDIKWDGKVADTGEPASEGTYYYICTVNTIRLSGIEPIVLKGFVSLTRGTNFSGN
jgi:gliding motility-associated-like protein